MHARDPKNPPHRPSLKNFHYSIVAAEDLLPARADAAHVDGHTALFFNEGQISLRSGREIVPVGCTGEI